MMDRNSTDFDDLVERLKYKKGTEKLKINEGVKYI